MNTLHHSKTGAWCAKTRPRDQRETGERLETSKRPARNQEETSKRPARIRQETSKRRARDQQDTTKTRPKNHQETTKKPPRHHRDTTEAPPRHHRGTTEKPPRHHQDTTEKPSRNTKKPARHHRDTTGRDTTETPPRNHQDTTKTPPKNHQETPRNQRDTTETPPDGTWPRHHRSTTGTPGRTPPRPAAASALRINNPKLSLFGEKKTWLGMFWKGRYWDIPSRNQDHGRWTLPLCQVASKALGEFGGPGLVVKLCENYTSTGPCFRKVHRRAIEGRRTNHTKQFIHSEVFVGTLIFQTQIQKKKHTINTHILHNIQTVWGCETIYCVLGCWPSCRWNWWSHIRLVWVALVRSRNCGAGLRACNWQLSTRSQTPMLCRQTIMILKLRWNGVGFVLNHGNRIKRQEQMGSLTQHKLWLPGFPEWFGSDRSRHYRIHVIHDLQISSARFPELYQYNSLCKSLCTVQLTHRSSRSSRSSLVVQDWRDWRKLLRETVAQRSWVGMRPVSFEAQVLDAYPSPFNACVSCTPLIEKLRIELNMLKSAGFQS